MTEKNKHSDTPAHGMVAPVDIYRVLKAYRDQDRFNWSCASALSRDIAALYRPMSETAHVSETGVGAISDD